VQSDAHARGLTARRTDEPHAAGREDVVVGGEPVVARDVRVDEASTEAAKPAASARMRSAVASDIRD
jgi:hypothetical protein